MESKVGIGEILSELIAIMQDSSREVLIFILVIGGLTALGVLLGVSETTMMLMGLGGGVDPSTGLLAGLFQIIMVIVSVVAGYILLTRYLAARGLLRDDSNRFWPYLGLAILSSLGIGLGFVLLIVPGVFLLVRWSSAIGFVIGEQRGVMDSLSASWEATKGSGWSIFFAGLIMIIGLILVGGAVGGFFGLLGATLGGMVSALLEAAGNAISLAFAISVYSLVTKDSGKLGEVFS